MELWDWGWGDLWGHSGAGDVGIYGVMMGLGMWELDGVLGLGMWGFMGLLWGWGCGDLMGLL